MCSPIFASYISGCPLTCLFLLKFFDASENNSKGPFNGFAIVQFASNNDYRFMDGIKTGRCIELVDDNIHQITGSFADDTLQVIITQF